MDTGKKTLCLNMIVKDESLIILDTLKNITDNVEIDYWVISDTGSTDNTCDIIETFFSEKKIPGELLRCEWKDFGYNRTIAIQAAYNKTDFLLIFDADDEICGEFSLPFKSNSATNLSVYDDMYMVKIGKGTTWTRPLIVNNRKKWMFRGILHEFLSELDVITGCSVIEGNYHINGRTIGHRSNNPNKYINDANILKTAYFAELNNEDKGLSDRYGFYTARSFHDAGPEFFKDAIEWYKIALENVRQWSQEKYYAAYSIGVIYEKQGNFEEALLYFLKTIEYVTERIEGIASAVQLCYNRGHHTLVNCICNKFKNVVFVPNTSKLFNVSYFYNDRLDYINSISAYYANDKTEGYKCCKRVILNNKVSDEEMFITACNLCFYTSMIDDDPDTLELFKMIDIVCYKNMYRLTDSVDKLCKLLFKKNEKTLSIEEYIDDENNINVLIDEKCEI